MLKTLNDPEKKLQNPDKTSKIFKLGNICKNLKEKIIITSWKISGLLGEQEIDPDITAEMQANHEIYTEVMVNKNFSK